MFGGIVLKTINLASQIGGGHHRFRLLAATLLFTESPRRHFNPSAARAL